MAAALSLSALLPSSSPAAGTYTVHGCERPDGSAAAVNWDFYSTFPSTPGYLRVNECPEGSSAFGFVATRAHPAGDRTVSSFDAPSGTAIHSYNLWRSVWLPPGYSLSVTEHEGHNQITDTVEHCPGDPGCDDLGTIDEPLSERNLVTGTALSNTRRLRVQLQCIASGSCSATHPYPSATYFLHRAEVTLADAYPPQFEQRPDGPLLDSEQGPLVGEQQVWVQASDHGSGVYQVLFEIDDEIVAGDTIDGNGGRCQVPFTSAQPCKSEVEGPVTFDTSQIPDGRHRLRLLVTDATGTNVASWGETQIRTANRQCNPRPRDTAQRVRASFAGGGKEIAIGARARPRVKGRLTLADGTPLANTSLCVAARSQANGAALRRVGKVRTNDKGRFSYRLPAGPSSRVFFVSRTAAGAASASVNVSVKAPVELEAARRKYRNGDEMRLRGELDTRIPARGVLVEIQSRLDTGWRTFRTTHAHPAGKGRKGEFQLTYTWTRATPGQRYQLRAFVPKQATYPYAPGASRPVQVRIVE